MPFTSFCCIIYKNAIGALGKAKAKCDKLHDYEMNVAPYSERKAIYYDFTTCPLLSLQNNSDLRKLCRHSATSIINQWNFSRAKFIRKEICEVGNKCDYTICGGKYEYVFTHPEYTDEKGSGETDNFRRFASQEQSEPRSCGVFSD